VRIAGLIHGTRANGPGLRTAVWLQGCQGMGPGGQGHCAGCQNPLSHDPAAGTEVDPDELADRIVREAPAGTQGITVSGGEPFQQEMPLYQFLCMLRSLRPDWTIGVFTGYSLSELREGAFPAQPYGQAMRATLWNYSISEALDWIVAGRYDRTRPIPDYVTTDASDPGIANYTKTYRPDLRLCSTANQQLHLLSRRVSFEDFDAELTLEFSIAEDGLTSITGFQPKSTCAHSTSVATPDAG